MAPRADLTIDSGGEQLAAWLYRPEDTGDRPVGVPCVVLAHGFTGTRADGLAPYAERFAAAGMAALVFDYRGFGDSSGQPRDVVDVAAQLDDWRAAVRHARTLPGVDPERIAVWGSSFSGGHVTVIAAEDPRIAAAVSQAPHMDGLATLGAIEPARIAKLTVAGLNDAAGALRGAEPHYLPAVGAPGTLAFMTSPDAEPGFRAIAGGTWTNRAAARVALRIGLYRPITKARDVRCPWLLQLAEEDAITPAAAVERAAAKGQRAELRRYPGGHFGVYVDPLFETTCGDQVAFLQRHLLGAAAPVQRAAAA